MNQIWRQSKGQVAGIPIVCTPTTRCGDALSLCDEVLLLQLLESQSRLVVV
jgi:hypothetical protein